MATKITSIVTARLLNAFSAPDYLSLCSTLDVPHEHRALVVVRSNIASNSTMRFDPALGCTFVFFHDRRKTPETLLDELRVRCSAVHRADVQREQYKMYQHMGATPHEMRRCCRIVSNANLWLFCEHTSEAPLLPMCSNCSGRCDTTAADDDEFGGAGGGEKKKLCNIASHDDFYTPSLEPLEQRPSAVRLPDIERTSHHSILCIQDLERFSAQLEKAIAATAGGDSPLCFACTKTASADAARVAALPKSAQEKHTASICKECMKMTLASAVGILDYAEEQRIRCSGKSTCICIYQHCVKRVGAVIEIDAYARPNDPAYEAVNDSIYDAQSPLVTELCVEFPDTFVSLVKTARLPRHVSRDVPPWLVGFGYTAPYDVMLETARRVYALPNAVTLAQIAVNNQARAPLFGDRRSLADALRWLPKYAQLLLRSVDHAQLRAAAQVELVLPKRAVFSPPLDRSIYGELCYNSNRLVAMSRIVGLMVPSATSVRKFHDAALYIAVLVALAKVCDVTAAVISQEKFRAHLVEQQQQQQQKPAEPPLLPSPQPVLAKSEKNKRRPRQQKAKRKFASVNGGGGDSPTTSPPSSSPPTTLKHTYRVLPGARDPRPPPLEPDSFEAIVEQQQKRMSPPPQPPQQLLPATLQLAVEAKEFVPHTGAAVEPELLANGGGGDNDDDDEDAVMALFTIKHAEHLLGRHLWNEMNET